MKQNVETKKVFRRLLSYLKPYRKRFIIALLAMTAFGATDGAVPFLIRSVLDDIFGKRDETMLQLLPLILICFALIRGGLGFAQQYLSETVGLRIVRDLRNEINFRLLGLSPRFFLEHTTGTLVSRVTNDALAVRTALTDAITSVLRDSIRIIALLIAALYLDPILCAIALLGFPFAFYPIIRFGKKVRKLSRAGQDQFGNLTSLLQEVIVGHRVVQAFTLEEVEQKRFAAENDKITKTLERSVHYGALSAPTNEFVASIAIALVILYGGYTVFSGVRTEGDFIAFLTAMFLMYEPVKKLGRVNALFQTGLSAAERIFEVLDATPDVYTLPGAVDLECKKANISYESVFFKYNDIDPQQSNSIDTSVELESDLASSQGRSAWVLNDISFTAKSGETIAIVGMSGGGKSTIVSLLPRFYDPSKGQILINGKNIRELSLKSLRTHIAIVSQHTFLFNESVLENIRYGRPGASREEVIYAAMAANAELFISRLPQGFDTVVGEQGFSLSGGERARLAIARALLKNAPILILDEATAALDSESEGLVHDAIDKLMEGRTVFVIAHRLATVRKANQILVVSKGQIAERGTHEQLLKLGGEYAKLYRMQFRDEQSELLSATG